MSSASAIGIDSILISPRLFIVASRGRRPRSHVQQCPAVATTVDAGQDEQGGSKTRLYSLENVQIAVTAVLFNRP